MNRITKFNLSLVMLAATLPAYGFTFLSGPNEATLPVSDGDPEITFYWDGSAPSIDKQDEFKGGKYEDLTEQQFMLVLLERAFAIWSNVKGSYLKMKVVHDEAIAEIDSSDKRNSIATKGGVNLSAAAFAQPILDDDANTIEDCDITISDVSSDAESILYTLVHEIGHCVGLGHNHTNYNSIMGYSRISKMPRLGADDKAGLIYLYPDPEYGGPRKEFLACAVIGAGLAWQTGLMLAPVVFLFGYSLFGSRRRKTKLSM